MSWLRLDDNFDDHPKVQELTEAEAWRWVRALLHCARHRTAGELSVPVLERLELPIGLLVDAGLLEELEAGTRYRVHDWDVYNGAKSGAERTAKWRKSQVEVEGKSQAGVEGSESYPQAGHGGRRGEYGSVTSSVTLRDVAPASPERHESISTRARYPQPQPHRENSLRPGPRHAGARGEGWVDNLSSYTGCRYVRGTHAFTAVYDVLGTERPPADWPHERPTRAMIAAELKTRRFRELEAESGT